MKKNKQKKAIAKMQYFRYKVLFKFKNNLAPFYIKIKKRWNLNNLITIKKIMSNPYMDLGNIN